VLVVPQEQQREQQEQKALLVAQRRLAQAMLWETRPTAQPQQAQQYQQQRFA
jgi:hypothetical protein